MERAGALWRVTKATMFERNYISIKDTTPIDSQEYSGSNFPLRYVTE